MADYDRRYITETIQGADSDTLKVLDDKIDLLPASTGTVTFNSTALASVNAEVDTALNTAVPNTPTANSLNDILSKLDGANTYDNTTDSLEAIADTMALASELAKVPKSDAAVTFNATALASVNAEVDTALNTIVPASPTAGSINDALSKAAGGNTFNKATDSLEALADTLGTAAELLKVPKSDSTVTWNATALASINAEVDTALNTTLAQPPTANSVSDIIHKDGSYTYDNTTDSLEAIRDKIDTLPTAGAVVSTASATTTGVIVQDGATATPNVVTVTPSATANTFGSWAALDASASADSQISHVTVAAVIGVNTDLNYCLEIGTGAISSEATKIRFSFHLDKFSDTENMEYALVFPITIPIKVASGVRIAARASASGANGAALKVGLSMYQSLET